MFRKKDSSTYSFDILNVNQGHNIVIGSIVNKSAKKLLHFRNKEISTNSDTPLNELLAPGSKEQFDFFDAAFRDNWGICLAIERDHFNFFSSAPIFHIVLRRSEEANTSYKKFIRCSGRFWRKYICGYELDGVS
jgi:hypothetical protein